MPSTVAPVVYSYAVQHAAQNDRTSLVERTRSTFDASLAGIRKHPPDTIGSGFFALMRLDEFVASRIVERYGKPCVVVGEGGFLGVNAGVIQYRRVGAWTTVGAGDERERDRDEEPGGRHGGIVTTMAPSISGERPRRASRSRRRELRRRKATRAIASIAIAACWDA